VPQVHQDTGTILPTLVAKHQKQSWRLDRSCNNCLQDEVIGSFEFYAGLAEKLEREGDLDLKVPDETLKIVVRKEPLGVCALITPWNYPLLMAVVPPA